MKFIIDNYSSTTNTQPLYFVKEINGMNGHEAYLNDFTVPIFSLLDDIEPDVYITSCKTMQRDLVTYMQDSNKEIKLLINTDECRIGDLHGLVEKLKNQRISHRFFGCAYGIKKPTHILGVPVFNLFSCVDLHNENNKKITWKNKIQRLYLGRNFEEYPKIINEVDASRKKITNHINEKDLFVSVVEAPTNIYHNYENIIFFDLENGLNQLFFEALYYGERVYFVSKKDQASEINEMINKVFGVNYNFDFNSESRLTDFSDVKEKLLQKHLPSNRIKTLLSQLN